MLSSSLSNICRMTGSCHARSQTAARTVATFAKANAVATSSLGCGVYLFLHNHPLFWRIFVLMGAVNPQSPSGGVLALPNSQRPRRERRTSYGMGTEVAGRTPVMMESPGLWLFPRMHLMMHGELESSLSGVVVSVMLPLVLVALPAKGSVGCCHF